MKVIYEPVGRAREYAPLAFNPWIGCTGGCRYCYAKHMAHKTAAEFHKCPVPHNKTKEFEADCKALQAAGDDRVIFMSFMCDPFQPFTDDADWYLIYDYLNIAAEYGRRIRMLTKIPSNADFKLFTKIDFGVTISGAGSSYDEPNTDDDLARLEYLWDAKARWCTTWVSMEPVLDVKRCLQILRDYQGRVDFWRVGKLNARSAEMKMIEQGIDWKAFGNEVRRILPEGKYILKEDLLREMGKP